MINPLRLCGDKNQQPCQMAGLLGFYRVMNFKFKRR